MEEPAATTVYIWPREAVESRHERAGELERCRTASATIGISSQATPAVRQVSREIAKAIAETSPSGPPCLQPLGHRADTKVCESDATDAREQLAILADCPVAVWSVV